MKKTILGIKIDDVSLDDATNTVEGWLKKPGKHYIVTPNSEIVVMAQKDNELKKIINSADLAVPDGIGLKLGRLLNRRADDIVNYSPGVDLMERLIFLAEEKGFTVGLLGGKPKVAKTAAERLKQKYQKLKVVFAESGGEVDKEGKSLKSLKSLKTDLLFVAFGPPKQEKWIAKNLPSLS